MRGKLSHILECDYGAIAGGEVAKTIGTRGFVGRSDNDCKCLHERKKGISVN